MACAARTPALKCWARGIASRRDAGRCPASLRSCQRSAFSFQLPEGNIDPGALPEGAACAPGWTLYAIRQTLFAIRRSSHHGLIRLRHGGEVVLQVGVELAEDRVVARVDGGVGGVRLDARDDGDGLRAGGLLRNMR